MSIAIACLADDFTGATDALESLSLAGLSTVMFSSVPSLEEVSAIPGLQAVVVASAARSWSAQEAARVRPILSVLRELQSRHVVFKVCSTFDSSPRRGNIGRVIEMGAEVFDQRVVPVVLGAPALGRFAVFGNLFAAESISPGAEVFRLDRHPVMSRHPVTPMREGDIAKHLSFQTDRRIGLFDVRKLSLPRPEREQNWEESQKECEILLCDLLTIEQQPVLGELLKDHRFVVGSSGATSSLASSQNSHSIPTAWPNVCANGPVLVISGSCSSVTGRQIETAMAAGWGGVDAFHDGAVATATAALRSGQHTILHTSIGPDDVRLKRGRPNPGVLLGTIARRVLENVPSVRRLIFAGGDTSSHALEELGIKAFRMITRITPGAPLCQGDGLEIVCKGGQVGSDDFFLLAAG